MKKRILLITAALALLAAAVFPVFADDEDAYKGDFDYDGVIDSESGYGGSNAPSLDGLVSVTSSMLYDRSRAMFVFPVQDTDEVFCSAADGMILTEPVALRVSGSAELHVYRNGEPYELDGSDEISQTGEYVVHAGAEDAGTRVCAFTIVGPATNVVHSYRMPDGFVVRDATLNGSLTDYSRYFVDMEKEGSYIIDYSCTATGMDYTLGTRVDRTPPKLVLTGSVGSDGKVHSAVDFSGLEPEDTFYVELDGKPLSVQVDNGAGRLRNSGVYHVVATDKAGNSETREFTIMAYLDSNGLLCILLVAAALAAVAGYAVYKRKALRIR